MKRAQGWRRIGGLAVFALLLAMAGASGWLTRIELSGLDALLRLNAGDRALPSAIVLVDIDQKSLEDLNPIAGNWPWPRAIHAELVDAISRHEPALVVFDLLLNEADTFRPESDALFADIIAAQPNVYLPTLLLADGEGARLTDYPAGLHITPTATARADARAPILVPLVVPPEAWRGGLINFLPDSDGTGRRYWLRREVHGWQIPSLPQRVATDRGWQLPGDEQVLLNWYGRLPQRISYSDLFNDLTGATPGHGDMLRGKIVIIGAAAPGLGDLRPTPLASTYPGVALLATAIGNLHDGDWLTDTRWGLLCYPLLLLPLLLGFHRRSAPLYIALALGAATALAVAGQYLLIQQSRIVIHVFAPLTTAWLLFGALALLSWWEERGRREHAVAVFGRFLDPRVVNSLVEGGVIDEATATHARDISILFSDIRGFTTLSERSTPEQVVALLNDYFSRQVEVIFRTRGTLDKFIGDAIMAFWGAPANDPDHARHAVEAALEMVDVLERFRADLGESGQGFDVGIGIHTGPAVVGFIGSRDRLDYTAIGDSVNLASRIEGATKGVARVLVSEFTMQACGDAFEFIDHGVVHVKGREQGVRLYEPRRKTAGNAAACHGRHPGSR